MSAILFVGLKKNISFFLSVVVNTKNNLHTASTIANHSHLLGQHYDVSNTTAALHTLYYCQFSIST
jgi:hypothetical protein